MKLGRILVLILFVIYLCPMPSEAVSTSAVSAILIDASTGTVLYEQNADESRGIASTTKIMTGLLTSERCDLDEVIEVSPLAVGVEGSSLYLTAGQSISVRELFYGLMLKSGNDAAAALAIHMAGSIEEFAALMNARAQSLSMTGSHFMNPHGLSAENHYATARDMAILTREALSNPVFSEAVGTKYYQVAGVTVKNHNRLLWSYEGADGVKTGYTQSAGRCLVSSATRNGQRLIAVTLWDRDDWNDHAALFDYGFENYTLSGYYKAGEPIAERSVFNGEKPTVSIKVADEMTLLQTKEEAERTEVHLFLPQYFWEDITEGQELGRLQLKLDGKVLSETALIAGGDVKQIKTESFWHKLLHRI